MFGFPMVFLTPRESTAKELRKEVRMELARRHVTDAAKKWKVCRADCGDNTLETDTSFGTVEEEIESDLLVGERQHIVLEWKGTDGEKPGVSGILATPMCADDEEEEEVSLEQCFEWQMEVEQLSEDDAAHCSGCKQHLRLFKRVEFWSLPPVLVLQLKRFEYTGVERRRVNTKVQFPLEGLDLAPFCLSQSSSFPENSCLRAGRRARLHGLTGEFGQTLDGQEVGIKYLDSGTGAARWSVELPIAPELLLLVEPGHLRLSASADEPEKVVPSLFDLAAVSKHIGGAAAGHYVAFARSSTAGAWHLFDDDEVTEVSGKDVAGETDGAYVLFYIRRDHRPRGWGPPPEPSQS